MASPSEIAERVLEEALDRPPTLGGGRLVCVDGLAGAGKTSVGRELRALAPQAVLIATDEMLEGWSGLPGLGDRVDRLLRPLAAGEPGRWRRWDWEADDWAEDRVVEPAALLVLEGVGSAPSVCTDLITYLAWIEADRDVRLARGLARDGEALRPQWLRWLDDEAALHEREGARERADLIVTTG
ncbi:MAG TPA: 4-amino-4-deoxy-L-arabinose transferase [Nocardioides sp.]|nr:4-amino-4-deoxy-L-arabinose transferase [Nocardioides sp.]HWJ82615.1 4-amino-4-deoxy-L-arabinose transferase [Nocardioides sp.]